MHCFTHSLTHSLTYLFIYSLTHSFTQSIARSLTHSLKHLVTHLFNLLKYFLTHPLIHSEAGLFTNLFQFVQLSQLGFKGRDTFLVLGCILLKSRPPFSFDLQVRLKRLPIRINNLESTTLNRRLVFCTNLCKKGLCERTATLNEICDRTTSSSVLRHMLMCVFLCEYVRTYVHVCVCEVSVVGCISD